jgi:acyl phosphate:glycerol-3-phosphate acyltransferase
VDGVVSGFEPGCSAHHITHVSGDVRVALVLAGAYGIGSIPWAWLVARAAGTRDLRRAGSGNVGATNVFRTSGPMAGAVALVLDVAKGAAAVALARWAAVGEDAAAAAGLLAVTGHIFPVWLRGRGGKGVATAAGVFALIAPGALVVAVAAFAMIVAVTRYVSLGSMLGALGLVAATIYSGSPHATRVVAVAVAGLIVMRHAGNVARLRAGTEPRLGARGLPRG